MNTAYDFWTGTLTVSYVVPLQSKCSYLATIWGMLTICVLKSVYSLGHEYFTFHVAVSRYSLIPKYVYSIISHILWGTCERFPATSFGTRTENIRELYTEFLFFLFVCRGMMMAQSLSRNCSPEYVYKLLFVCEW